ncbi:ribonuclease M5 [Erysipelothrix urinaevulpis]|uniref:ribonuclease M5 n=1 Tax=Erysipelothrix urinaevulpis TaxID=2683717 RepID=UPI0013587703|nr:ribonuclease M5 [Erysipelothrix urinaevulpis]
MKIREVIIVEGKHDVSRIKACVDADVLVTNGTHVSQSFLEQCKKINETRGIILFTDPDGPGEWIRRRIMDYVGDCEHASLDVKQAKSKKKVGIEHASCEMIKNALLKRSKFVLSHDTISKEDFNRLGLSGKTMSQARRDLLSEAYSIPKANAKTMFKYLNMVGATYEECKEHIEVLNENNRK